MSKNFFASHNVIQQFVKFNIVLLSFSPLIAFAEEILNPNQVDLEAITVIGTRSKGLIKINPYAVTIINQKKIARNILKSIAETVENIPGVGVTDSNSAGTKRIRIRGESSKRVTILIDGQELTDHSNYGTPILENISEVSRIEVVRGPASILYGAKAIGGVVNIVTKDGGGQKTLNGEIGSTYFGDSDGWLINTAIFGHIGNFDYRLSAYKENHDDIKVPISEITSFNHRLAHTKMNSKGVNLNLAYTLGENYNHWLRLKIESSKLSSENWREPGILNSGFIPLTSFDISLPKRDKNKIGLFYDGEDLNSFIKKIHFDAYYQKVKRGFENFLTSNIFETDDFVMLAVRGNIPSLVEQAVPTAFNLLSPVVRPIVFRVSNYSSDDLINYGGTFQVDFQLPKNHYVLLGLNYLSDQLKSDKISYITFSGFPKFLSVLPFIAEEGITQVHPGHYKAHMNTISLFAQDEWQMTPDLKLTAGLRYYKISTVLDKTTKTMYPKEKGHKFLKAISLVYTGIPKTSFRINYSEGYITPNLMQLFITTDTGGIASLPNPKLKPETSKNIEIGARYAGKNFSLDGTAFYTQSKDYISLRTCRNNPLCIGVSPFRPSSIYENTDKAKTYGVELSADYLISNSNFTPYLELTWMKRKESLMTRNTYETDVPKLSGRLGLRYEQPNTKIPYWMDFYLKGASGVKLAPELNPNNPGGNKNMKPLAGWVTVNLAMGIKPKLSKNSQWQMVVKLNNITNTKYRSSFSALPGSARNASLSVKWNF